MRFHAIRQSLLFTRPVRLMAVALAVLLVGTSTTVRADSLLSFDFSNVVVQGWHGPDESIAGFLGSEHTGVLRFSTGEAPGSGTRMDFIDTDEWHAGEPSFFDRFATSVDGYVHFEHGSITGGEFAISVQYTDDFDVTHANTLSYDIAPSTSSGLISLGNIYGLKLDITNVLFSHDTFATLDVSPWRATGSRSGASGTMLSAFFTPEGGDLVDMTVNVQGIQSAPTPSAIGGGLALLTGLLLARRRRLQQV